MARLFRKKSKSFKICGAILGLAIIYLAPLFTVPGFAEIFLRVDQIKGESRDQAHKDWIDTFSYQHGVSRAITSQRYGTTPQFSEFVITKRADIASPLLFQETVVGNGKTIDMELIRGTEVRERYYRVKLYDAFVTGFSTSSGGDAPSESVSFNFGKIELTYTEFTKTAQDISAWYDVEEQKGGTGLPNSSPTISPIANTNTLEDLPVRVSFTIGDAETSASSLILSANSSNTALVPTANITFGGSDSSRMATIRPATNQVGSCNITIFVSDGTASASRTFAVTVNAVNDAPTIATISGKATEMGSPLTFSFNINDVDTASTNLAVSASSSNPSVVPNSNIAISGTGTTRDATITPSSVGDTTITFSVSDGELTNSTAFLFTVNAYTPKSPTNVVLSASTVQENSTNGFVIGTFTAQDPDSGSHTFVLLDDAGGRFSLQGNQLQVNNGTLLNYETAASHSILVRATDGDNLSFSKNLTIAVINVNEAPSFIVADTSVIETISGRTTRIDRLQVTDPDAGTNNVTLTLQVVNGAITVSSNFSGSISSNGTAQVTLSGSITNLNTLLSSSNGVVYVATTNLSGTDVFTATINDEGNTGVGVAHSVFTTLGIRFYRSQYEQWLFQKFTESELNTAALESSLWGPHADSDGDGLENIAEYGLGTPPRSAEHPKPGAAIVEMPGGLFLSVTLPVRQDPDLLVHVEAANDVNTGEWSAEDVTVSDPAPLNNGFDEFRFDDRVATTDAARRFMRIRWTLQNVP